MPGAVWTLAAYQSLTLVNLLLVVFFPATSQAPIALLSTIAGYCALTIVTLLWLRERTPIWLLQLIVLSILGYLTALVSSAPTPQGALAAAIGYVLLGMYVAIWGSARLALAYVPLMALVYAVALSVSGLPKMASAWLVIVAASLGTAVVINSLVRSLRSAATID
ncbi:MAG: hypothetical protein NTX29_02030, partial [Actinobacteria bacterium]|nr:hypothetical protein [Actinomycetota bacterium]